MADPRVADQFRAYQFHDEMVDLSEPSRTSHAIYWYNLQLVFVTAKTWRVVKGSGVVDNPGLNRDELGWGRALPNSCRLVPGSQRNSSSRGPARRQPYLSECFDYSLRRPF